MESLPVGRNRKNISWTPLMDDYFINLMVKEVHRGTKVVNSFAKHGWSHMERSFQQKFGVLYNKDCMKNRLKTLKKQYNVIKSLCEQSGIVWNHEFQMVVVNDEATWEAYIKDHPEAQKYRDRCLPHYEDLCLIFSHTPADEEDNVVGTSAHIRGINVEVEAMDMHASPLSYAHDYILDDVHGSPSSKSGSEGTESPVTSYGRKKLNWTPLMDRYFVSLMVEEVHRGTRNNDSFSTHGWNRIEREFQKRFGAHFHRDSMRARLEILRKQFNCMKTLCEERGFVWNPERQMITATDESLWDDYTKVHPEAREYKGAKVPYYEDLCAVFSPLAVDGRYNTPESDFHTKEIVLAVEAVRAAGHPSSSLISSECGHQANGVQDSSDLAEDKDTSNKRRKHLSVIPRSIDCSRKSCSVTGDMVKALQQMAAAVNGLATAFKEVKNCQLVEKYISALSEIPGMDPDLFLAACDLLEDERKAKTFLALNMDLRKRWLIKKLRPF
ncbi:unnamed protein product [Victoria cruziana]